MENLPKQQHDNVPWTIEQTRNGILLTVISYLLLVLLIYTINPLLSGQPDVIVAIASVIFTMTGEGLFLVAPLYFAKKTTSGSRQEILRSLGFRRFNTWRIWPWILLFFLALFPINELYQWLITIAHLNWQTNDQVLLQGAKGAPLSAYATLLTASLIAPFCEEIFFRSFILMGFLKEMSVGIGIISSAFLFALIHLDLASFPILWCIGLTVGFLRWRSNSIWPGIILHMLNNASSGILIFLVLHNIIK